MNDLQVIKKAGMEDVSCSSMKTRLSSLKNQQEVVQDIVNTQDNDFTMDLSLKRPSELAVIAEFDKLMGNSEEVILLS